MDNTIILVVIGAELALGCLYLRRIARALKKSRAVPVDAVSPLRMRPITDALSELSSPARESPRQTKPRPPTLPDRPSRKRAHDTLIPAKRMPDPSETDTVLDLTMHRRMLDEVLDVTENPPLRIDTSDLLGIPTDEELVWAGTHDLNTADLAGVVEHETEFFDFGAALQASMDHDENPKSISALIEEELMAPDALGRLPSRRTEYAKVTKVAIGDKVWIDLVDPKE